MNMVASGIEEEFFRSTEDLWWNKSAVLRLSVVLSRHVLVVTGAAERSGKEASSRPQLCP